MNFGKTHSYGLRMCGPVTKGQVSMAVVYGRSSLEVLTPGVSVSEWKNFFKSDFIKLCTGFKYFFWGFYFWVYLFLVNKLIFQIISNSKMIIYFQMVNR